MTIESPEVKAVGYVLTIWLFVSTTLSIGLLYFHRERQPFRSKGWQLVLLSASAGYCAFGLSLLSFYGPARFCEVRFWLYTLYGPLFAAPLIAAGYRLNSLCLWEATKQSAQTALLRHHAGFFTDDAAAGVKQVTAEDKKPEGFYTTDEPEALRRERETSLKRERETSLITTLEGTPTTVPAHLGNLAAGGISPRRNSDASAHSDDAMGVLSELASLPESIARSKRLAANAASVAIVVFLSFPWVVAAILVQANNQFDRTPELCLVKKGAQLAISGLVLLFILAILHLIRLLWNKKEGFGIRREFSVFLGYAFVFLVLWALFTSSSSGDDPETLVADYFFFGIHFVWQIHTIIGPCARIYTGKIFAAQREKELIELQRQNLFDLKAHLQTETGWKSFCQHLNLEFSVENIYFWTAVQKYKLMPSIKFAREIYDTYIDNKSPLMVNISSFSKNPLIKLFKTDLKDTPLVSIFDKAQSEVWALMETDSLRRYLASPLYKEYLAESRPDASSSFLTSLLAACCVVVGDAPRTQTRPQDTELTPI